MKLVGLVFLGLVSGFAITYAGAYLVTWLISLFLKTNGTASYGGGGEAGLMIGFLVIFPIAFFIGGIVTGYFSYYEIEDKRSLLLMAPALYVFLLAMGAALTGSLLHGFINGWSIGTFLYDYWGLILAGPLWYSASAGGVFLGYYLRERFAKWWYGD
jgi:hypothetical protein